MHSFYLKTLLSRRGLKALAPIADRRKEETESLTVAADPAEGSVDMVQERGDERVDKTLNTISSERMAETVDLLKQADSW